jgi:F420-dependent hydroxymycolic acid dehydrogenase
MPPRKRTAGRRASSRRPHKTVGATAAPEQLASGLDVSEQPNIFARNCLSPTQSTRLIGFMLPHEQFPVPELVRLAIAAEHAGFDFLATSDHFQPWQDNQGHSGMAWITMAAIVQKTTHIRIGTTVTCPTYRYHPAVVAEAFASLALLAPNRIFLGVGSGEALNEQAATGKWDDWATRSERLIEAIQVIRALWKGEPVSHKGQFYDVCAKLYDVPPEPVPLLIAANGPKALQRAAIHADGLVTDPKTWKQYKLEFLNSLQKVGRDPARVPVLVEQYAVVGTPQEADEAISLWRFGPKAWKPYYNFRDPKEIEGRAMREVTPEQVTEGWPISTDPNTHIEVARKLFDSGATMVNIHSGQRDQLRVIDFYGEHVIPKLRLAAAGSIAKPGPQ